MGQFEHDLECLINKQYKNKSCFANKLGIPKSTLYTAFANGILNSNIELLILMADNLDLDLGEFVRGRIVENASTSKAVLVPLYGSVSAGTPLDMLTTDDVFPISAKLAHRYPNAFMLRVNGSSVNNVLPDGYYALIKPLTTIDNQTDLYVVAVGNEAATIKHVQLLNNGIRLLPDSDDPTYHPLVFDYSDANVEEVRIIGKVVWSCPPVDA